MAHHDHRELISMYLKTVTTALIAVGAATGLDVEFGKALVASFVAALMPVLVHLIESRGE